VDGRVCLCKNIQVCCLYTFVQIYLWIDVNIYVYTYRYIYMCTCIHTYIQVYVYIHIYLRICVCICMYAHLHNKCTHACIHAHTPTHTHTHKHTRAHTNTQLHVHTRAIACKKYKKIKYTYRACHLSMHMSLHIPKTCLQKYRGLVWTSHSRQTYIYTYPRLGIQIHVCICMHCLGVHIYMYIYPLSGLSHTYVCAPTAWYLHIYVHMPSAWASTYSYIHIQALIWMPRTSFRLYMQMPKTSILFVYVCVVVHVCACKNLYMCLLFS